MMALFGGIAHAPLAVMLMVAEMTGNLSLLAPAMIAVGISSILVGNSTIYTSQVNSRADSPAHRLEFSFPLLSTLTVRSAMKAPRFTFSPAQSVAEAERILNEQSADISGAPVLNEAGQLLGTFTRADIQHVPPAERKTCTVRNAMHTDVLLVQPEEALDDALEQLTEHRVSWVPVVNDIKAPGKKNIAGILSAADIMQTYRRAVLGETKRMRKLVDSKPNIDT
jgi:CIC family chloride channel protein